MEPAGELVALIDRRVDHINQRADQLSAICKALAGRIDLADADQAALGRVVAQLQEQLRDIDARLQVVEDQNHQQFVQPATRPARRLRRPHLTGRWQRYRLVDCPACDQLWLTAEARYDGAYWIIRCPDCGEQTWRAVLG
ncbi:MAG: hypothetical protein OHK0022_27850 [Roseiflexaceae bacterium]